MEPARAPECRLPLADFVGKIFPGRHIEHLGRDTVVSPNPFCPGLWDYSLFFQAVHACYNLHYPLALRPEVLAYLMNHEIAVTVNQHPEDYRYLFTSSSERQTIKVKDDLLVRGNPASDWGHTLGLFEKELARYVPVGCMDLLMPHFTTETPESRTATLVAFMDSVESFYEYTVETLCGIPRIRLDGVPEDYEKLCAVAEQLAAIFSKHLGLYFEHLLPVLRKIAEQAAGAETDHDFWSKLYCYYSGSGHPVANGWITAFLAYVNSGGELAPKMAHLFNWTALKKDQGIQGHAWPTHVSSAPFQWQLGAGDIPMRFMGGVLGVENEGGFISPQLSYGVIEDVQKSAVWPAPAHRY